ncbi:excinuclease ABC subunit C [Amphritea opalescens]|uniref:Excinuclease ABC subunit C n=1 Tax=Amphritea opalescens TaxID=2490544 RepID=A0A430KWK9_9GAMM|nr:excinuclease ABC subunit C [Amphritea opalescens]RTE67764.1 excinuclease ABC subunit C [Amphritea opalescens]
MAANKRAVNLNTPATEKDRHPLMSDSDINTIMLNGAMISLSKLKRAQSFNARLYYYAEISVYLEVSLSRGAGISDATRQQLEEIHREATHYHMDANKLLNLLEE